MPAIREKAEKQLGIKHKEKREKKENGRKTKTFLGLQSLKPSLLTPS